MLDRRQFLTFAAAVLLRPIVICPQAPLSGHAIPPPEGRVDINHASVDELMKVPGMTRSWADRIVRFRPYQMKTDLQERGVIPSRIYDRIKDYVIAHHDKQ